MAAVTPVRPAPPVTPAAAAADAPVSAVTPATPPGKLRPTRAGGQATVTHELFVRTASPGKRKHENTGTPKSRRQSPVQQSPVQRWRHETEVNITNSVSIRNIIVGNAETEHTETFKAFSSRSHLYQQNVDYNEAIQVQQELNQFMTWGHGQQLNFFRTCNTKLAREFAMRFIQHLHDSTYISLRHEQKLAAYDDRKNSMITDLKSRLEDSELHTGTLILEAKSAAALAKDHSELHTGNLLLQATATGPASVAGLTS